MVENYREYFNRKLKIYKKKSSTQHASVLALSANILQVGVQVDEVPKPHTLTEELILSTVLVMVVIMVGESVVKLISNVSLFNNTSSQRILKAKNLVCNLITTSYLFMYTFWKIILSLKVFFSAKALLNLQRP